MADNATVSNSPSSSNADIPVRSVEKSGKQTQVVTLDLGGSGAESLVSGSIPVVSGLSIATNDYVSVSYPTATQEVYTFKSGGSGGTTVATVTVNYTDSTKDFISNVAKT